jgi:hypothetical protein
MNSLPPLAPRPKNIEEKKETNQNRILQNPVMDSFGSKEINSSICDTQTVQSNMDK